MINGVLHMQSDDESSMALAQIVGGFMAREGLTLQAMAERCGLSIATIAAIRDGAQGARPKPETVAKLAAAMGGETARPKRVPGGGSDRHWRELMLLKKVRALDSDALREVEQLVDALSERPCQVSGPNSAEFG